jgi:hypothetical protein
MHIGVHAWTDGWIGVHFDSAQTVTEILLISDIEEFIHPHSFSRKSEYSSLKMLPNK